jgi:hypothetical protein
MVMNHPFVDGNKRYGLEADVIYGNQFFTVPRGLNPQTVFAKLKLTP